VLQKVSAFCCDFCQIKSTHTDVDDVIDAIRASFPTTPLFAMGVSAGANCLSLYAGVRGAKKHGTLSYILIFSLFCKVLLVDFSPLLVFPIRFRFSPLWAKNSSPSLFLDTFMIRFLVRNSTC
jgi:hypothetical protein